MVDKNHMVDIWIMWCWRMVPSVYSRISVGHDWSCCWIDITSCCNRTSKKEGCASKRSDSPLKSVIGAYANNRQLHQSEYDMAKKNAKLVAKKLGISEAEAEGRIVAEILSNSDKQTAEATGGKHDYEVRSILGCQNLNCDGYKNDPQYANNDYNKELIVSNQGTYDAGQAQLGTGKTYDELVTDNVQNNPVSTGIAGAAMVGYGAVTGGTSTALGIKVIGAGIGATVNAAFQSFGDQSMDWSDVGMAGMTGFITTGSGFVSSLFTNVGGALTASAIKGENPNSGMVDSALGTSVGYGLGKSVEVPFDRYVNPWYRPDWKDAGVGFGITKPNTPNPLPGITGNALSSGAQEATIMKGHK